MNKPNIVLIPVDYLNSRKKAEEIEGMIYSKTIDLRNQLAHELIGEDDPEVENGTAPSVLDVDDVLIYSMTDFMDACNDQEIYLEGYFITYVYFEEKIW